MRLIDADVFKENMDYICDAGGWLEPVTKAVREFVKRHIDAQTTVKPEPQWIPCSERLPEDKQECLITAKALNMFCIDLARFGTDLYSVDKYDFHYRKGKSGWYYFDSDLGFVELPDVVAWMPLPEPYREVEE